MTNEEIYIQLKQVLVESFMIEEDAIRPDANLYTDLDFDSIDAIDLAAKIHLVTGKQLKPEQFRNVRTINDAVEAVAELIRS